MKNRSDRSIIVTDRPLDPMTKPTDPGGHRVLVTHLMFFERRGYFLTSQVITREKDSYGTVEKHTLFSGPKALMIEPATRFNRKRLEERAAQLRATPTDEMLALERQALTMDAERHTASA